jgi:hypothetical protein
MVEQSNIFSVSEWLARGEAMGYRVEATIEPRRGLYVWEPDQPLPDEDMEWHRQRREHHREIVEHLAGSAGSSTND